MIELTEKHYQDEIERLCRLCDVLEKARWRKADDPPPFGKEVLCYDIKRDRLFVGELDKGHPPRGPFWSDEECTYVTVDLWADVERPKL